MDIMTETVQKVQYNVNLSWLKVMINLSADNAFDSSVDN